MFIPTCHYISKNQAKYRFSGYPSNPIGDSDNCFSGPSKCLGPQFQLHSLEKQDKELIEVLDEIHFSYGGPKGQHYRFLRGEVYSGTVLRTQHYLRVTHKEEYNNKSEVSHGHLFCPLGISWDSMTIVQQVACAQSSFTVFRPLDIEKILYGFL